MIYKKEIKNLELDIIELDGVSKHLLHSFQSGDYAFDAYLKTDAIKEKYSGDGVTSIVVNHDENDNVEVVAYYTLSAFAVNVVDRYDFEDDDIPPEEKRERFSPIPAIMIRMFAVDSKYQDALHEGQLVSSIIFKGILDDINDISNSVIGAKMIVLCSVDTAVTFYSRNGFKVLPNQLTILDFKDATDNVPMYLTIHEVTALSQLDIESDKVQGF